MSSHKHHEHLERIKDAIHKTDKLDESQKKSSVKIIEEWYAEDLAFDALQNQLLKVSIFFEDLFGELGLTK
ncbi:hypothetical protein MNB_SM-3-579 [hydrothermal vent metagenome]|uniref:Uncharacterized protein n=1 Tax=hydrothermal vent metagenome TaxID=652676 RepID=A0A1W1D2A4_9ZZZZ